MAPKKTGNAPVSQTRADSYSDATTMDASQDIDTTTLQELLSQHKQQVKHRRKERKEAIVTAHKARLEKLRSDIDQAFAERDETIRAIRRPKIERLIELVRKKRDLEHRVDNCVEQMEATFLVTSEKLQIAIDARLDVMSA
ncbi:hypothetical protein LTR36_002235 [Oleoguttula mirabilis]|uniref:Uncharacterized protein n=1 Tax=Oleoguttula mirabilis TaxID=1507867 RepID=A0AAV9JNI3_9PEZI|nr:hypothetical protein LTR36_002235 [Oleoguttula mirabilis]